MTNPSSNRAVMVVLAYLWPLAIVPLLAAKGDADIQWHAKHGLLLLVAEIVLLFTLSLVVGIASLASLGLGCAVSMLFVMAWTAILIVHLTAILKGLHGSRLIVPWVSDYASRF